VSDDQAREAFGIPGLAFQDHSWLPSQAPQRRQRSRVARHVAADLCGQVGTIGLWDPGATRTVVAVPEASVHEQGDAVGGEDEVGLAGQVDPAETETQAEGMGGAAYLQLGFGVA